MKAKLILLMVWHIILCIIPILKKTKQNNIKEDEDPNYTMRKLFEVSQSAFILATSTFNYTIINGYVSKTYILNIIKINYVSLNWIGQHLIVKSKSPSILKCCLFMTIAYSYEFYSKILKHHNNTIIF